MEIESYRFIHAEHWHVSAARVCMIFSHGSRKKSQVVSFYFAIISILLSISFEMFVIIVALSLVINKRVLGNY